MDINITVLNRTEAAVFNPKSQSSGRTSLIRITSPLSVLELQHRHEFENILELRFADMTDDNYKSLRPIQRKAYEKKNLHPITNDQARDIVCFVTRELENV